MITESHARLVDSSPPRREGQSAAWDPAGQRMIVLGGSGQSSLEDVWILAWDGATWTWSEISPAGGPPPARSAHSAVWDTDHARMIVYDGHALGDVWTLSEPEAGWTWPELSPVEEAPSQRFHHLAA